MMLQIRCDFSDRGVGTKMVKLWKIANNIFSKIILTVVKKLDAVLMIDT